MKYKREAIALTLLSLLFIMAFGERLQNAPKGTPTDHTAPFSLISVVTAQITYTLTGSGLSGVITKAKLPNETLNGITVTPYKTGITLSGRELVDVYSVDYIDSQGNLIEKRTATVSCVPAIPDKTPALVLIGDKGTRSLLTCSNGWTAQNKWEIKDAFDDRIQYIVSTKVKNQNGIVISKTTMMYTINRAGEIASFSQTGNHTFEGKANSVKYGVIK